MSAVIPLHPVTPVRTGFIGGSDAAAILGLAPRTWERCTSLDVYLEKRGEAPATEPDPARDKVLRRGKRLEPVAIDMLIEEYGVKVVRRSTNEKPIYYADKEHDFLRAQIDFEFEVTPELAALVAEDQPAIAEALKQLVGTVQNGEIKTVHKFASAQFGEDAGTQEVPIEYAAQAMHGLMVTHRQITMFGVLVSSDELLVYWVLRDDETIAQMRRREVDFWLNNVQAGVPPEPINLPDVFQWFRMVPTIKVDATDEIVGKVQELVLARQNAKAFSDRAEELKFELGVYMLGESAIQWEGAGSKRRIAPTAETKPDKHELRHKGRPILTVGLQNQTRIDSDAIKEKYPEVALECRKPISFFRFDQPRKK